MLNGAPAGLNRMVVGRKMPVTISPAPPSPAWLNVDFTVVMVSVAPV